MSVAQADAPNVRILLLGDAGVGKSTFISRVSLGTKGANAPAAELPDLRDLDQPHSFNIRMYNRPYLFEFYDTSSPTNYTLLTPAVVILCYSIADPDTLRSVQTHWKEVVEQHFNYDESLPVILLGLKRDVRQEEDYDGKIRSIQRVEEDEAAPLNARRLVYPQEALRIAQEMRCDRYCECSALTGELSREVFEDVARVAAMTTTAKGAKSDGAHCAVM